MQYTHSARTAKTSSAPSSAVPGSGPGTGTGTGAGSLTTSAPCGCGCHQGAQEPCGSCKLTCFERPKYFCGQLLSDADLTLQEAYFREKNKLHHRALDGYGVVCGLQIRCESHCKGHITIGDGYAIDSCGNDLVVCEPRSFDVIGELRKKKWLVEVPSRHAHRRSQQLKEGLLQEPEDVSENDSESDCIDKVCYYIGICYVEEPLDFATPYTTECDPAPGPCQATRVREGVRFEVYDKLPLRPNSLDVIGKRIKDCFQVFREGQFSRGLTRLAPRILDVLDGTQDKVIQSQAKAPDHETHCLFEELRAQFVHELRIRPDQYNCDIEHEVYRLRPPRRADCQTGPAPLEAFTKLFELIQKYVLSCVLAQLAFSCPEPPDPCCVLIGSVEVQNGRLTRVINYPRWYLWCFANFFEVLIYRLANDAACGHLDKQPPTEASDDPNNANKNGCCPGFEVDVCQFLNLFSADNRAFEKAASMSVDAIQASYNALVEGFNFIGPGGIAPATLRNLNLKTASSLAKAFRIDLEPLTAPGAGQPDVFSALADNRIYFGSATLVYEGDATVNRVNGVMGAPAFAVGKYTQTVISDLMERHTKAEDRLKALEKEIANLKSKIVAGPSGSSPSA